MSNVGTWSTTAGLNNSSPPDGWPEGMARSAVNDCAREMMAALAKWYADSGGGGGLASTNIGNAYSVTTNAGYASYSDVPILVWLPSAANTGAITLNVDGLGAKSVIKNADGDPFTSGDLTGGTLVVVYDADNDVFTLIGPSFNTFPSGTLMLFQQTAAPTGWTKQTTHNDKALRVVTGSASSGGSTAFTSVFASRGITQANLPSGVNLSASGLSVGTSITNGSGVPKTFNSNAVQAGVGQNVFTSIASTDTLQLASGAVSGTVPLGGSGTGMDFAVQYVDLIIASADTPS